MPNPNVNQGSLNRIIASISWPAFPQLNITAPFLGDDAIGLSLEGETTTFITTLTGAVTSPEVYQVLNLTAHLLKTQSLADAYKQQMELNALLGNGVIRPDVTTLSPYNIVNAAIQSVDALRFSGKDAGFIVAIKGYYQINSSLFD